MNDDRIVNQIEGLDLRRFTGCLLRIVVLMIVGGVLFGLVVKHTQDVYIRAALTLTFAGLLLGFSTAVLAIKPRQFLTAALIAVPATITLMMFARRTLYGEAEYYPLRLILSPLSFSLGYIAGQLGWRIWKP